MKHCYLYQGTLTHYRINPRRHFFAYKVFMVYLDLDEIYSLPPSRWWGINQNKLISFHDQDYLDRRPTDLRIRLKNFLLSKHNLTINGPIRMLTNLRTFGFCFNPVTFYYCYNYLKGQEELATIVADINNTPWNEKHAYVLSLSHIKDQLKNKSKAANKAKEANKGAANGYLKFPNFAKKFHVSPFFSMEHKYAWKFTFPELNELRINMKNLEKDSHIFSAHLNLKRREFSPSKLLKISLLFPFITLKVFLAIYYQALKLFLKRIPFFNHPKSS